jgi:hypothetical protein
MERPRETELTTSVLMKDATEEIPDAMDCSHSCQLEEMRVNARLQYCCKWEWEWECPSAIPRPLD